MKAGRARQKISAIASWLAACALLTGAVSATAQAARALPMTTAPLLTDTPHQASAHVYVIKGFPNVGIIVGTRATLVVDTGLGARNGAYVARAARKLSPQGQRLYLTTTHFHPEHASGWSGFPPGTLLIRNQAQQREGEADAGRMIGMFASFRPPAGGGAGPDAPDADLMGKLLAGATFGAADVVFDHEADLDLGGVHARLLYFGAAHTLGDELVYIPEDGVLLPGDVVQDRLVPNPSCDTCSPRQWLAVLDQVAALRPRIILPDHGGFGGPELIGYERSMLSDLQTRAAQLRAQGKSADESGRIIAAEFTRKYADWQSLQGLAGAARKAYANP